MDFFKRRKIKQVITGFVFIFVIILSWKYYLIGMVIPVCMVLGIGIGFFRGRKWCDWYCPRGSFYDAYLNKISFQKRIPDIVKDLKLRLIILALLMIGMIVQLYFRWPDINKIGQLFVILLSITTLTGIFLGIIYHQRIWCYFCPVGTIAGLVGKNKNQIKLHNNLCTECNVCSNICPMQLNPFLKTEKNKDDCISCKLCISKCPKNALHL